MTSPSQKGVDRPNRFMTQSNVDKKNTNEQYEVHTVRVIEESDSPQVNEASQVRDRIMTRGQTSRLASFSTKEPAPNLMAPEASTSVTGAPIPIRDEEPGTVARVHNMLQAAETTLNTTENTTNQLLCSILSQMQALFTQLDDTNQRVANLQEHVFRQEEPQVQQFAAQPVEVPILGGEQQFQTPRATLHWPSPQEPWPQLHLPQTRPPPTQRPQTAPQQDLQGITPPEQPTNLPGIRRVPQMQQQDWQIPVTPHFLPPQPLSPVHRPPGRVNTLTREEVQQMITNQLGQGESGVMRRMGRPYPAEYDAIPYPSGYTVPKFKSFNGIGNPIQHLAHFIATCGNTGNNDALLLRQFSQSLTGVAFEWYYSLESGSVRTWVEMENMFASKFASVSDTVDITTLVNTRMKKDESPVDYITRWRNLSIRCEHPLDQAYAVDTVIANIDNWMSPFLRSNKPRTFQELITQVARLEKSKVPSISTQPPSTRFKKAEAKTAHARTAEKQKGSQRSSSTPPQNLNKPIFGGNSEWKGLSLEQRKNKKYSFRRDKVYKIFKDAVKNGLQLPESKRPEEASRSDDPMYCPYHKLLGHPIEDCYVFKDWVEK